MTLASPESLPSGSSPRLNDVDFLVGGVHSRYPLKNVFTLGANLAGPNPGSSSVSVISQNVAWANPTAVLTNSGSFASALLSTNRISKYFTGGLTRQLQVTGFGFNLPLSNQISGITASIVCETDGVSDIYVQLIVNGAAIGEQKTVLMPSSSTTLTFGGDNDMWGILEGFGAAQANLSSFGIEIQCGSEGATVKVGYVTLTLNQIENPSNFNWSGSYPQTSGGLKTLALDGNGTLWLEDAIAAPGTLTGLLEGIAPGSYGSGVTAFDREYMAFSDLYMGVDRPRQYTPQGWVDGVTQVGPGAPPTFTPISSSVTSYGVDSITQPTAQNRTSSYFLQSTGPGSTSPGNVVTVYYSDSTESGPDTDLVAAFNSGNAVYLYFSFTGGPAEQGPYVVQVTSVGEAQPPGQPRSFYYFTFNLSDIAYTYYQGSGNPGYTANYQRTLATMTMNVPVPGMVVGSTFTIAGASVTAWNNQWTVSQTPNSASMSITQTSVTSGVVTYSYVLLTGAAPTVGELVTVTGTNNDNGALNVTNATIVSASGGASGTFTVNLSVPNAAAQSEEGQSSTAGTIFDFDPGAALVGSATNPIYGNSTGGSLTFASATGQFMSPGTRQGVVFFITRNGAVTFPSPPVTFSAAGSTITGFQVSNLPIGPPNVVARGVAFTEAGQNGVPGGFFYYIPENVSYVADNITYLSTATVVNDNTTTSATFNFQDAVLLSATEIDVQGNDLFNQIEIGDPGWVRSYAGRMVYGLCKSKVQNFNNLSFDGGYLYNPSGVNLPLGWNIDPTYAPSGSIGLANSPVTGNSLVISNATGAEQSTFGMIWQSAYQDAYLVPILLPNVLYSVRVSCRNLSASTSGSLVVDLTNVNNGVYGSTLGTYSLDLADMTAQMATYTGTILTTALPSIPSTLALRVWLENCPIGASCGIDRIEIFPTLQPVDASRVYFSYAGNPEGVDGVTGIVGLDEQDTNPVNGCAPLYDKLYLFKPNSTYMTEDSPNYEPSDWDYSQSSNTVGAIGPNAYDFGEEWIVTACRAGIYGFNGGQPMKLNHEIFQVWDAVNWEYGNTIWVRNDVTHRKIYVGVPMALPNAFIPNPRRPNANPTHPNVVLMLDYQGMEDFSALVSDAQMHVTMFGKLASLDMRRKWSLWQMDVPYADFIMRGQQSGMPSQSSAPLLFCNGIRTERIYQLGDTQTGFDDDYGSIPALYTTYGLITAAEAQMQPQLGTTRKRFVYFQLLAHGAAATPMDVTLLANSIQAPSVSTYTIPGGIPLTNPAQFEYERPLNFIGQRAFIQFSVNQPPQAPQSGNWFAIDRVMLIGQEDVWAPIRGVGQ